MPNHLAEAPIATTATAGLLSEFNDTPMPSMRVANLIETTWLMNEMPD
jgi:hypothetical protein